MKDIIQALLDIINIDEQIIKVNHEMDIYAEIVRNKWNENGKYDAKSADAYCFRRKRKKDFINERAKKKSFITRALKKLK